MRLRAAPVDRRGPLDGAGGDPAEPRVWRVLAGFCSRPRVPACPRARARERGRGTPELRLGLAPGVVPGEASDVDAALLAAGSRDCHLPACAPPRELSAQGAAHTESPEPRSRRGPRV